MRKIVELLLVGLLFTACETSSTSTDASVSAEGLDDLPPGSLKEPYEDDPNMVKVTINYSDGTYGIGDYVDGQRHGSWTIYNQRGLVQGVETYINGMKQGIALEFDETSNQISTKSNYHNGLLHGKMVIYNRARIKEERPYVNGKIEGTVKIYYDDGTLLEESPYQNGVRHGTSIWYDQNGVESIRYVYENGELQQ